MFDVNNPEKVSTRMFFHPEPLGHVPLLLGSVCYYNSQWEGDLSLLRKLI